MEGLTSILCIVVFAKREPGVKDWIISCLPRNTSTYISFLAHSNIHIKQWQWVWNQINLIQRHTLITHKIVVIKHFLKLNWKKMKLLQNCNALTFRVRGVKPRSNWEIIDFVQKFTIYRFLLHWNFFSSYEGSQLFECMWRRKHYNTRLGREVKWNFDSKLINKVHLES